MSSNSSKGSYYKARTKKWLEGLGYSVAHLERMLVVRGKPGLFVKRDQLGSDLLAVSPVDDGSGWSVAFVQVKMGGATWKKRGLSGARNEFAPFPVPPGTVQMIVVWEPRARAPLVWIRRHGADWTEGPR